MDSSAEIPSRIVVVYAILLTYLLVAPHPMWVFGESGMQAEEAIDDTIAGHVQHVVAYALFMLLVAWWRFTTGSRALAGWALLLVAHGALAELAQGWIPGRHAEISDAAANGLGVLLAWGAIRLAPRFIDMGRYSPPRDS